MPNEVRDSYRVQHSLADQAGANSVLTFSFGAVAIDMVIVVSQGTGLVARADVTGTPSATTGVPCFDSAPSYIPCVPANGVVSVYAPNGTTISVIGLSYA